MTKTLRQLVAMALAIVVELIAFSAVAGPLDKMRQKVKDIKEAGEAVQSGEDFMAHTNWFFGTIHWIDFVSGRNIFQALVICLGLLAFALWTLRKWEEKKTIPALVFGYLIGVGCGLVFEWLYSSQSQTAQAGAWLWMTCVGAAFAFASFWHLKFLGNLREAIAVKELWSFLHPLKRMIPGVITAERSNDDAEDSYAEAEYEDASQSSVPTASAQPEPTTDLVTCSACGEETEKDKPFCGHCLKPLQTTRGTGSSQSVTASQVIFLPAGNLVTCSACGNEMQKDKPFCGHCLKPLQTRSATAPVGVRRAKKRPWHRKF